MDLPELSDGLPGHQSIVIFVNDFGGVPGLHGSEIFVASLCVEITDKGVAEPTRLPRLQSGSFLDFLAQIIQLAHRFPLIIKDPGQYRPRPAPVRR
jgi:hypothetical protein